MQKQKMVTFHHGALCDEYEKQANEQGLTLGEKAELFRNIKYGVNLLHIQGVLIDSHYDHALKKIQKMLVKSLRPLQGKQ